MTRSVVALTLVAQLLAACTGGAPSSASPTALAATSPTTSPAPRLTAPAARGYHALIGLGDRGVLLVGGETAGPALGGKSLSDPWIYGGGKWVAAAGGLPRVGPDASGYDAKSERAIVLSFAFSAFEVVHVSGTWIYDPAGNRWEERPEAGRPALIHGSRGAYDRKADRLIVVDEAGKTWSYDVDANHWTDRLPQNGPLGRRYYTLAYDEASDRTILFGGEQRADTWAYDFGANTWTEMRPAKSPPGRLYHAMAYDPKSDRMILFGGAGSGEKPLGDTWTYDYDTNTWTELTVQPAPSARGWHAMAYDAPTSTVVLFGGGVDRGHFLADTWVFDPTRRVWSSAP
ncbi:MAG TPA: kelch repeat-containing protein [Candidatus Limnocylindria bacterium]|nr:kelch repeat-containing protein [Candidatus Limnocylindria bacterium]